MSDEVSSMPIRCDAALDVNVISVPNGLSRKDYFAFEFSKLFITLGWGEPLTNGVAHAETLIKYLDKKDHKAETDFKTNYIKNIFDKV